MRVDAGRLYCRARMLCILTLDLYAVFGDAWYFLRCLQKMISKANFVCGICRVDCLSTERTGVVSTEKCWRSAIINSSCCCGVFIFIGNTRHRAWGTAVKCPRSVQGGRGTKANPGALVLPSPRSRDGVWAGAQPVPPPIPGTSWEGSAARWMGAAVTSGSFCPQSLTPPAVNLVGGTARTLSVAVLLPTVLTAFG